MPFTEQQGRHYSQSAGHSAAAFPLRSRQPWATSFQRGMSSILSGRSGGAVEGEARTLAECHTNAIELAAFLGCRALAFPAISTGIYGYPPELAAPVALRATLKALAQWPLDVRFVLFDEQMLRIYERALAGV